MDDSCNDKVLFANVLEFILFDVQRAKVETAQSAAEFRAEQDIHGFI